MKLKIYPDTYAQIDNDDYEKVKDYSWRLDWKGYVVANLYLGGGKKNARRVCIRLHRLITDAPLGKVVDHIDGDKLDNRKKNLRICTNKQNCWNAKAKSTNTSGYKGVSWHKQRQKWCAKICYDGRGVWLGLFENKEDASAAYNDAAKRLFGVYARVNHGSTH